MDLLFGKIYARLRISGIRQQELRALFVRSWYVLKSGKAEKLSET